MLRNLRLWLGILDLAPPHCSTAVERLDHFALGAEPVTDEVRCWLDVLMST